VPGCLRRPLRPGQGPHSGDDTCDLTGHALRRLAERRGDADTTVPPQHARLFAAAIPGAQLQLHPGHGHFSILGVARQILAPLAA